jgi:AcrR family transcriptional regulator
MPFTSNDETKNRILESALDCFLEKGYLSTTVVEVGKKAGVNKALIYYYFSGKELLLKSLILTELNSVAQFVRDEYNTKDPNNFLSILFTMKKKFQKFLQFLIKEIVAENQIAVLTVTEFLDSQNIQLQSLFNPLLQSENLRNISALNNRELILAVISLVFGDLIFSAMLSPTFNINEKQVLQFKENYNQIIHRLMKL